MTSSAPTPTVRSTGILQGASIRHGPDRCRIDDDLDPRLGLRYLEHRRRPRHHRRHGRRVVILRSKAWFIGSRTHAIATGLVQNEGTKRAIGFVTRVHDYDQRLDIYTPPNFPVIHNGTLKVLTWQEK